MAGIASADPNGREGVRIRPEAADETVLRLRDAELGFGSRVLWSGLDLEVHAGEFIAVLGANGSGKSSLLKAILGQLQLRSGSIELLGSPVAHGDDRIGYIPQQRLAGDGVPLRGGDLIGLGIDGHRWGIPLPSRRRREAVDRVITAIGAGAERRTRISDLSGGEQQRLRVGQALVGDPRLLLCDEPFNSLDPTHQRAISELVGESCRDRGLGVVFVTHDINPLLGLVDRVLYIAGGSFRIGTPDEVLTSEVLSELYGGPVDVIRVNGRIIVAGAPEGHPHGSPDVPARETAGSPR